MKTFFFPISFFILTLFSIIKESLENVKSYKEIELEDYVSNIKS